MAHESLMSLLSDPNHWAFELIGEVVTSLIGYPFIRLAVRLHDRRKHGKDA